MQIADLPSITSIARLIFGLWNNWRRRKLKIIQFSVFRFSSHQWLSREKSFHTFAWNSNGFIVILVRGYRILSFLYGISNLFFFFLPWTPWHPSFFFFLFFFSHLGKPRYGSCLGYRTLRTLFEELSAKLWQ